MYDSEQDTLQYRRSTPKITCNCLSTIITGLLVTLCVLAVVQLVCMGIVLSKHSTAPPDFQSHIFDPLTELSANFTLPYKHSVTLSTPAGTQDERGTAWAFTIASMLEHSYRTNGIDKGFLNETTYLPFSVQALAIKIFSACKKAENYDICKGFHRTPEQKIMTMGEVAWFYYLPELFSKVFPESICPYQSSKSKEMDCPGLNEWIAGKKNPLKFNIKEIHTAYSESTAKSLLYSTNATLGLTMTTWKNKRLIPCDSKNPYIQDDRHSPFCPFIDQRVECPPFVTRVDPSDNCIVIDDPETNNDGEYELHSRHSPFGPHHMAIVGYNSHWRTSSGDVGGFIVKNSRRDSVYPWKEEYGEAIWGRGSHSIGYWMGRHSTWDERMICANPLNPVNWFSCTSLELGPTSNTASLSQGGRKPNKRVAQDGNRDVSLCLNKTYADDLSKTIRQPYQFRCVYSTIINCTEMDGKQVFLDSISFDENGLATAIFVYQKDTPQDLGEFVVRNVHIPLLVSAIQPVEEQAEWLKNDPDNCGYYFIPFSHLQTSNRLSETWNALHFEIEWDDQSYAKNKESHPELDYSLIEASTKEQKQWAFDGPLPHAKKETNIDL